MIPATADAWRAEYPFASHWLDLDGLRYHYVEEGPSATDANASAGTVLAVHGNPTWSFYWRRLILGLQDQRRVVAVDHIGCGLSEKPQQYPYTLAQHRDNLLRLIEQLDLRRITLVAHDWGGAIGLAALLRQTERFERIVLLNTAAFPPPYMPWRIAVCRTPLLGRLAVRGANAFARAAVHMAVARQPLSPTAAAGLLAPYGNWHDRVAIDRFVQDIPTRRSHDSYALLEQIGDALPSLSTLPSLLVWGMRDWCFRPECLRHFQSVWPGSGSIELGDCGHYVMEEAPQEVVAGVRDFLGLPSTMSGVTDGAATHSLAAAGPAAAGKADERS